MDHTQERYKPHPASEARPFYVYIAHKLEDFIDDINWIHIAFKLCAFSYIAFMAWIAWQVLPVSGHWNTGLQSDRLHPASQDLNHYFDSFTGFSECKIHAYELYAIPPKGEPGKYGGGTYCPDRKTLLQAMSTGGRIGFDAAYTPKDCYYRWYTVAEICMILERFDNLVFIGDDALELIYNGLNILLRQDLASGSLQTWSMDSKSKQECQCDQQFTKTTCSQHFVRESEQVSKSAGGSNGQHGSSYICERTPHVLLRIGSGKPSLQAIDRFNLAVAKAPKSNYKSIPIVHSISPMTASHKDAAASLLEFLRLADESGRKTPMLWIGPTAAGHIEIRGRKTNQEIWDFDNAMARTAEDNDIEVLKMWNMTVQATSWDGVRFGERVALVQAMMVINWLSRLESS